MINVIGIKHGLVSIENEIENEEIYRILTDEENNFSSEGYSLEYDLELNSKDESSSEDSIRRIYILVTRPKFCH